MADPPSRQVTLVLQRVAAGQAAAAGELLPLVYDELRRLAQSHLRQQGSGHTLQATALVHEAYLRLVGSAENGWESRAHFFAVAATAMRQILSNHARDKRAAKRGGARLRVTLSGTPAEMRAATPASADTDVDLLDLHDALEKLAELDGLQSRVVELRFFAAMSVEEIGHVLSISPATVKREWRAARAWLNAELEGDGKS